MSLKRSTNHLTDNVMVNETAGTSSRAESPHVINTPLRSLQQCPGGSLYLGYSCGADTDRLMVIS